ncbi:sensor histidine kinase [Eubacterium sp. MSJ-13]|uniref:sensor histidine kinase n=1 Tax=Eubacterium sp. MSJ-13 TaxID=2841513 RepID=UPI001C105A15|nr:sensor histidine kinase [Eubacterium sp. MSJ-13]MBU5478330.1 sensor histidine kinase [Eubacterium sp. MSJ-13]
MKQNDCIYGVILESMVFITVFFCGFVSYLIKYKKLKKTALLDIDEQSDMPETSDCVERLYQEIVENQIISRKEMKAGKDKTDSEMLQYYGMWVHQIKTPIAAMRLLLQMDISEFADDREDENVQNTDCQTHTKQEDEYTDSEEDELEKIYLGFGELKKELSNELFQIEQYTDMALQYQRVQSETNDFVLQKVKLDKVIRESIRKYAKIFIRKKLAMHYEGTDITVASDEKWLGFIIEQLLSNAIKYTKAGSITISVCTNELKTQRLGMSQKDDKDSKSDGNIFDKIEKRVDSQNKSRIIFVEISDEGIGINAEDIPRVFEKGYTGYNGHENKTSTGIGLYLCKQAADKLGHRLEIESEEKKGTKVRMYLKVSDSKL